MERTAVTGLIRLLFAGWWRATAVAAAAGFATARFSATGFPAAGLAAAGFSTAGLALLSTTACHGGRGIDRVRSELV